MPAPPYVDDNLFRPYVFAFDVLCLVVLDEFHFPREIYQISPNVGVYVGNKYP